MPPKANSKFWRTGLGGPQPPPGPLLAGGHGERDGPCACFRPLRVILDKWIPKTIFAAPRNSWPRGGASYNNRKAA
jgi:hypothetical protein